MEGAERTGSQEAPTATDSVADGEAPPTVSKKALKRQLKQEYREQKKRVKKEQQKQQKQAKREARPPRQPRDPSTTTTIAEGGAPVTSRKEKKKAEKEEFLAKMQENFSVVIDVAWEDKHNERALRSLKQQIVFCYGFNKRHSHPVHIHLSGMGPLLGEQLVVKVNECLAPRSTPFKPLIHSLPPRSRNWTSGWAYRRRRKSTSRARCTR